MNKVRKPMEKDKNKHYFLNPINKEHLYNKGYIGIGR